MFFLMGLSAKPYLYLDGCKQSINSEFEFSSSVQFNSATGSEIHHGLCKLAIVCSFSFFFPFVLIFLPLAQYNFQRCKMASKSGQHFWTADPKINFF
jgi:hypothetical protein